MGTVHIITDHPDAMPDARPDVMDGLSPQGTPSRNTIKSAHSRPQKRVKADETTKFSPSNNGSDWQPPWTNTDWRPSFLGEVEDGLAGERRGVIQVK